MFVLCVQSITIEYPDYFHWNISHETKKESFECLNFGLVKGKIAYRIKNTTSHEIFYVSTEEAKEKYLKQIIKFLESKIVIVSK